jgi:hypothetical protein
MIPNADVANFVSRVFGVRQKIQAIMRGNWREWLITAQDGSGKKPDSEQ